MSLLHSNVVLANSGVAFGTSGARGLVEQFTPDVCAAFTLAFIDTLKISEGYYFFFDKRPIPIYLKPSFNLKLSILSLFKLYIQPNGSTRTRNGQRP